MKRTFCSKVCIFKKCTSATDCALDAQSPSLFIFFFLSPLMTKIQEERLVNEMIFKCTLALNALLFIYFFDEL